MHSKLCLQSSLYNILSIKSHVFFSNVISVMSIFSCSPTLSQISLKKLLGKWCFKFWPKSKWREIKKSVIWPPFCNGTIFSFSELCFFIVNTYMFQISLQNSGGKVVFLGGAPWNPNWVQREWEYLGHLSVNVLQVYSFPFYNYQQASHVNHIKYYDINVPRYGCMRTLNQTGIEQVNQWTTWSPWILFH